MKFDLFILWTWSLISFVVLTHLLTDCWEMFTFENVIFNRILWFMKIVWDLVCCSFACSFKQWNHPTAFLVALKKIPNRYPTLHDIANWLTITLFYNTNIDDVWHSIRLFLHFISAYTFGPNRLPSPLPTSPAATK